MVNSKSARIDDEIAPCLVQNSVHVNKAIWLEMLLQLQRIGNAAQACGLIETEHQVHVLDGLPGGTLDQVVDG